MKSSVKVCALLLCGALSCSCSLFRSSPEYDVKFEPKTAVNIKNEPKTALYQANAITMNIRGNPLLNLYHDRAHPVYLCIYQLKEPNWFNQSTSENGGIENLMNCSRLDPSVAFAKRVVVQPGQELVEKSDKAEGVSYLGIVAGYYNLKKEGAVRLYAIPKSRFSMTLDLGSSEIQNLKVK